MSPLSQRTQVFCRWPLAFSLSSFEKRRTANSSFESCVTTPARFRSCQPSTFSFGSRPNKNSFQTFVTSVTLLRPKKWTFFVWIYFRSGQFCTFHQCNWKKENLCNNLRKKMLWGREPEGWEGLGVFIRRLRLRSLKKIYTGQCPHPRSIASLYPCQ